jgi:rubrerythrin
MTRPGIRAAGSRRKTPAKSAYADFMSRAYSMELEAVERYAAFAEQLDTHNNREVAQLFRKLSAIEALHANRILTEMGWPSAPLLTPAYAWETSEAPETAPYDSLHYLMQPFHALEIALRCEQQAQAYFEQIAASDAPPKVRAAATEMAEEEREHVRLINEWLKRVPKPQKNWDHDPDPPRMGE